MLFFRHFPTGLFCPLSVAALCAGAPSARAQTPETISLTQVAPAALRLRLDHPTALAGRVQVVRLSSGQTLFAENYAAPAYGHQFNFGHVPSGRYLVRLQAGGQVHRCLVRVQARDQGASIRVLKLTSRAMPAAAVVKTWQSASGNGAVAPAVALSPTNPPQGSQGNPPNQ